MRGALLILFLSTPQNDWEPPGTNVVVDRLKQLINLGFQLTDIVMEESFHLFELVERIWEYFNGFISNSS